MSGQTGQSRLTVGPSHLAGLTTFGNLRYVCGALRGSWAAAHRCRRAAGTGASRTPRWARRNIGNAGSGPRRGPP